MVNGIKILEKDELIFRVEVRDLRKKPVGQGAASFSVIANGGTDKLTAEHLRDIIKMRLRQGDLGKEKI